jgi:hypothetical protein
VAMTPIWHSGQPARRRWVRTENAETGEAATALLTRLYSVTQG